MLSRYSSLDFSCLFFQQVVILAVSSQQITYDPDEASKSWTMNFPGVNMSINILQLSKNPQPNKNPLAFFLQFKWHSPVQKRIKEILIVLFSSAPLWLDENIPSTLQLGKYTLIKLYEKLIFRERLGDWTKGWYTFWDPVR